MQLLGSLYIFICSVRGWKYLKIFFLSCKYFWYTNENKNIAACLQNHKWPCSLGGMSSSAVLWQVKCANYCSTRGCLLLLSAWDMLACGNICSLTHYKRSLFHCGGLTCPAISMSQDICWENWHFSCVLVLLRHGPVMFILHRFLKMCSRHSEPFSSECLLGLKLSLCLMSRHHHLTFWDRSLWRACLWSMQTMKVILHWRGDEG